MELRTLGRTGARVSVIGFGGIPIQGVSAAEADAIVGAALDAGITFFDSARGYTDSEEKLGRVLGRVRENVFIATKSMARDAVSMRREIETSLSRLAVDCIDLYQLHNVATDEALEQVTGPGGALEALDEARRAGKIRFVGITSHSRTTLIRAIDTDLFDTVQHPYNPLESEWRADVVAAARARGLGIIAMKPAAGGAMSNVPGALRFALNDGVDVAIPGMDSVEQVRANAAAGAPLVVPTPEDEASFQADAARWQGAFCRRCGYCKPCPNGLDIPFLFLIEAYFTRYGLADWGRARLAGVSKTFGDCVGCGDCVPRCPYGLRIPEKMAAAAALGLDGERATASTRR